MRPVWGLSIAACLCVSCLSTALTLGLITRDGVALPTPVWSDRSEVKKKTGSETIGFNVSGCEFYFLKLGRPYTRRMT